MNYQAFHYFLNNSAQDPENPQPVKTDDICKDLLDNLKQDGDYFGLVDENDASLQVFFDADEQNYWVEIPVPEKQGSFGAILTYDELSALLKKLPGCFKPELFPDFEFNPWPPQK